jgi:hypothetical protein
VRRRHAVLALLANVAGCSGTGEAERRVESDAELQAQDERAFANSPDVQLPELRLKLIDLGVPQPAIRQTTEDHGVEVLSLILDGRTFASLDKAALAKLQLDSRYRFDLADPGQSRALAHYSVAEDAARRKQRYWKELAANGEIDIFPRYRPGSDMTAYARSLERYCGYAPGQALNVIEGRWLEYRNAMADRAAEETGTRAIASFKCIVRIVYATELQPYFIGNRGRKGVPS